MSVRNVWQYRVRARDVYVKPLRYFKLRETVLHIVDSDDDDLLLLLLPPPAPPPRSYSLAQTRLLTHKVCTIYLFMCRRYIL